MADRNLWIDEAVRNRGCFRKLTVRDMNLERVYTDAQFCNDPFEYEDALIEALDAGLTAEEISDILMGAIC